MENLPFIDGTDRIFLNTATMPMDAIDAVAAAESQSGARMLGADVVRTVMGRLGWQSSLDDVDPAQVAAGLPDETSSVLSECLALADDIPHLKALIKERSAL